MTKRGLPRYASTAAGLWVLCLAMPILLREPRGYLLFLLASAALHEAGHLCAFLVCGERVPRFSFRAFGFLLTPRGTSLSYGRELVVAAAGPLFNLFAALSLIPALRAGNASEANFCFFALNLLTATLNFLPIYGFDGWRVLRCALLLFLPQHIAEGTADAVSAIFAVLFYFFSLFLFGVAGGNILALLLSVFLLLGEVRRRPFLFEDFGGFARKREIFAKKRKNPLPHRT
ncbi:MAG: M50 family metallopeptidase [Clostridia bacterium]|nr:M50 family metallopeptidase [Clostridia bacterium]